MGKPNDSEFQHSVIAAALALLARPNGPVLEDLPFDAPTTDAAAPACPVSFAAEMDGVSWPARLSREVALLQPWYEISRRRRGRTTVGVSQSDIHEIAQTLGEMLHAAELPVADLKWFKYAIEDAKAFYAEALTAQPGLHDHEAIEMRFWDETQLGAALRVFYERFRAHPRLRPVARIVAPRAAIGGSTG